MDHVGQWLWYANLVALAGLLVRIHTTGLRRIFRFLFVYFLVEAVGSLALMQIPVHSVAYSDSYMYVQAVLHILAILAVLELYRVALAEHPGLARFGRASFLVVTLAAAGIAAASALLGKDILSGQSAIMHRFFTLERALELIILIFVLVIAIFITWFPVKLSRNVVVSISGFAIFYFTRATGLLAVNLLASTYLSVISDALMGASLLCLVVWALALRPERSGSADLESRDPAALARLSHQLDAINSALLRFGRH